MKDWEEILRRTDIISEMEEMKKVRELKDKKKKARKRKTNAQIDAEKTRLAEYQEFLARKLASKQMVRLLLEKKQGKKAKASKAAQALAAAQAMSAAGGAPSGVDGAITTEAEALLQTADGRNIVRESA